MCYPVWLNIPMRICQTCLTDAHLDDCVRVNLSGYTPDYNALVDSMQCQNSH